MHLIYLDESGNTGVDLTNTQQPIFVLGALLVPETKWLSLEADLSALIERYFPSPRHDSFELHATELVNARGPCREYTVQHRLDFYRDALTLAAQHELRFVYRAILKKRFAAWLNQSFGGGVIINPHVAAFSLISQVLQEHLLSIPGKPLGILISDDNREVAPDVEKSIRILRQDSSSLRLGQIIEKGFFIDSRSSLPLQLCDLCTYAARRTEELKAGFPVKALDERCVPWLTPLVHRGNESYSDVIAWLKSQQKKERPGA
ncbi:MAG TPA: DUF3800 domain-containing protein [Kiritimatiellia bacterium]|nr:DUF3800 domain-containing protein [Kiritimatiellia bacterium]